MSKSVSFTTETTYLFSIDVNGSALPKESGPPIGLAKTHHTILIEKIDDGLTQRNGKVRKFDHLERIQMLKKLYDAKTLALFCYQAIDARKERIETKEELERNEQLLRARRLKRAAEMSHYSRQSKQRRMMTQMEYEQDESEDEEC
ncbi:hypothetical protein THRCLA_21193 [Thraustotheca clavata]|uniref:Uncharacterized protein n=1 Tax=Thraustotheca clavata TaxID=74557 RepID=A0A1V9ZZ41_9STRA|nr:hypothetical protein THRCLA_21193 [Thraustotheca clavata]